ncbi:hypothetical protein WKW79_33770 [Variovorax robiniae]|uniref:Class I SAM-dependent methyltransferase n=1 Tax=Variovorax robiniae TaxID=1836199 RepID=A0ABU8XI91_9BURK
MDAYITDATSVRDISGLLLDSRGRLQVVPARSLEGTTAQERLVFGVRHGLYSFPTEELCDFIRARIRGKIAIEIGAGHGALAAALAIPATDNRQQEDAAVKAHYRQIGQPTVPYGDHVEKLDAASAVRKYRPNVVVACWVTHRFDARRPDAEGGMLGVDEAKLIASCDEYIFIGSEQVHARKPIWALPHEKLTPSWLYSRAVNGSRDFIAIWRRKPSANIP